MGLGLGLRLGLGLGCKVGVVKRTLETPAIIILHLHFRTGIICTPIEGTKKKRKKKGKKGRFWSSAFVPPRTRTTPVQDDDDDPTRGQQDGKVPLDSFKHDVDEGGVGAVH